MTFQDEYEYVELTNDEICFIETHSGPIADGHERPLADSPNNIPNGKLNAISAAHFKPDPNPTNEMLIDGMQFECVSFLKTNNSISNFAHGVDFSVAFQEDYKFLVNGAVADAIESEDNDQSVFKVEMKPKRNETKQDSTEIRKEGKRHACDQCAKSYAASCSLARHKHSVHQMIDRYSYTCDICNRNFSSYCNIKTHMRTHTKEKPYPCDICNKPFATKDQVKNHKISVHDAVRPYECEKCSMSFSDRSNLGRHKRNIHQKIESYVCPISTCQKRFSANYSLKCHMRIHTGKKLYKCDICKKSLAAKDSLNNHKKAVHYRIRSHGCRQCKKTFSYMGALRAHEKVAHRGTRPSVRKNAHACDRCGIAFNDPRNLIKHKEIVHAEISTFTCYLCDNKRFVQYARLKKHMQFVHL